jgi:ribosomal protein S18 acetylase RimI-like enzyme
MTPVDAVERNLLEFFRHFARVRGTGRIADLEGVSIASSGIVFHMFNAAFFAPPAISSQDDLARRIDLAAGLLGAAGSRWAFWACEEKLSGVAPASARRIFRSRGLVASFRHPGMVCRRLNPPRRALPELEFRQVNDAQSRAVFAHINSIAFRIPFEWCLELYDIEALWDGRFWGCIGYHNGEAVSTAATLAAAGTAGIYCVATLPAHERKGYGEAMTRHAVARVRQDPDIEWVILQATVAGLPLYRRMGFEEVTSFVVYSR